MLVITRMSESRTYQDVKTTARRLRVEHAATLASADRLWPIGGGAVVHVYATDDYGDLSVHVIPLSSVHTDARRLDPGLMSGSQLAEYARCVQAVERWKAGEGDLPDTDGKPHVHDIQGGM